MVRERARLASRRRHGPAGPVPGVCPVASRTASAAIRACPRCLRLPETAALQMLSPAVGSILSRDGPVPLLRVNGGRRPLTFLMDGVNLLSAPGS